MRGYPRYNFDAFHAAEAFIRKHTDWDVQNPARQDEEEGFNPDENAELSIKQCEAFFDRDVLMIKRSDGIVMLPGWQKSIGAKAEYWIAKWLCKRVYQLYTAEELIELK